MGDNVKNIPVLHVNGKTLAETYEMGLLKLEREGTRFKTQYDKPDDPQSVDATMNLTIDSPLTDPMIHKAFPGGIEDLREYVLELQGYKDHWVKNINDPKDTRWEYTYHGRFKDYGRWKERKTKIVGTDIGEFETKLSDGSKMAGGFGEKYIDQNGVRIGEGIDQIEYVISKLVKQPFTRQAQIITWMPNLDLTIFDPPCIQSLWYRIAEEDGEYYLNCNVRIRSNDAWGACFMNMFGLTIFNREIIADEIQKRSGKKVHLARMNWQADSWHIYGKDIKQARERLFDRVFDTCFASRVYNFYDPDIQEIYFEADANIKRKIEEESVKMAEIDGKK